MRSKVVWMALALASLARAQSAPWQQPTWPLFVNVLQHYQRSYPGLFVPPELVRWDRLPMPDVKVLAEAYASRWRRLEASRSADLRTEKIALSREANQSVHDLVQSSARSQKIMIMGTSRALLATYREEDRPALTPLDEVFRNSSVGQRIYENLRRLPSLLPTAVSLDTTRRELRFENSTPAQGARVFLKNQNGNAFLRTARFDNPAPLGPDVAIARDESLGNFWTARDSSLIPFGPFPAASNRWVDESGVTHFKGDACGHKH